MPSVGWPANGNSSCTVKIRTRTPALALDRGVARQNERGLRKIHLARDRLHLLIAEAARIGKHRQGVALEWLRSKYIQLHEWEVAKIFCHATVTR